MRMGGREGKERRVGVEGRGEEGKGGEERGGEERGGEERGGKRGGVYWNCALK